MPIAIASVVTLRPDKIAQPVFVHVSADNSIRVPANFNVDASEFQFLATRMCWQVAVHWNSPQKPDNHHFPPLCLDIAFSASVRWLAARVYRMISFDVAWPVIAMISFSGAPSSASLAAAALRRP